MRRLAAGILRCALRVWPAESRELGRAIEAELGETESGLAALRWAIGGVMLLSKAWWRELWRSLGRPMGVPAHTSTVELMARGEPVPRMSRAATALLLIASVCVLLLPDARQGLGVVAASWTKAHGLDNKTLERMARTAEENADAKTLAFAALRLPYSQQSVRMAERAVTLDPELTWIYTALLNDARFAVSAEQVARLRPWDPQNAVPHLVAAERAERALAARWSQAHDGKFFWGRPETNREIAADPEWLAAMERAFAARKYDSYLQRRFELDREVMQRHGVEEPLAAILGVMRHWIPSFASVKEYARAVLARGERAERTGDRKAAESFYWTVAHFSERVKLWSQTDIERLVAAGIQKESYSKLRDFLEREGRANEAALLASQLQALESAERNNRSRWSPAMQARFNNNLWSALMVQAAAGVIVILAAASAVSVVVLLFWRRGAPWWRQLMCVVVDYGPLLLLLASGYLYVSYHPFAEMFRSAMASRDAVTAFQALVESFNGFYRFPVVWSETGLWAAAIVALAACGSYVIWRMARRRVAAPMT